MVNVFKTVFKQKTKHFGFCGTSGGSNQGHMDFQSIALPSELGTVLAGAKIDVFGISRHFLKKSIHTFIWNYDFNCWYRNTRIKAAVFEEDILLDHFVLQKWASKNIENILKKIKTSHIWSLPRLGMLKRACKFFNNEIIVHFVSHNDPFPFVNETPKR
jgi:hypothetical protein